jgi:hypothetical protein
MQGLSAGGGRRIGLSALLVGVLAGCAGNVSGDGPNGNAGTLARIDACSLLTPAEIQEALGKPVKAGVPTDRSGDSVSCDWDGQVEGDAVAVTLQIDAFDMDLWRIETSAEGVERMPGIGDEAVRGWITNGLLLIRTGAYEVDLGVIAVFADDATIKAAQDRLGKLVVSRL